MHIIVIHGHLGDTVALVASTEGLDQMNLMYTEIPLNSQVSEIVKGNTAIKKDLALLLGIHLDKSLVGL